ncbi:MAG: PH domain-containing protein [Wenzhouxiangella sp.]|nr:PH domain-containing protein [Wenzhouxiangella sp.]
MKENDPENTVLVSATKGLWITLSLMLATLVVLVNALLWRGGASLGFMVAFIVLLPLSLAAALMQWWPLGRDARKSCRSTRVRHAVRFFGVALGISALATLLAGVAWSGGRVGNMLLVSGIALLPPAVLVGLFAWIAFRVREPEDLLTDGERLELAVSAHWTVFVTPLLLLALALGLALGPFGVPGLAAAAALYLIGLPGSAGLAMGQFMHSGAVLGEHNLYLSHGLLRQSTVRLAREDVKAIGVKQNRWTRLLGQGKLSVVDRNAASCVVAGLRQPKRLLDRLDA